MKKFIWYVAAILIFTGTVHAQWIMPSKSFEKAVTNNKGEKLGAIAPAAGGENGGYLVPTAGLGLGVDNVNPSYGVNVGLDLIAGHVAPIDSANSGFTPWLGFGGGFFADLGPTLNSNLSLPPLVDASINIVGPMIQGIDPGIIATFNFNTGERKILVNMNVVFGPLANAVVTKVFGLP